MHVARHPSHQSPRRRSDRLNALLSRAQRLARLPRLVRLGLLLLSVGFVADLTYHALPVTFEPLLGAEGFRAHLLTFIGMLVMLIGVIRQGLADSSAGARSIHHLRGGLCSHAHR